MQLDQTAATIAVFDPDHLCPPGLLGRRSRMGLEVFQPELLPNELQQSTIEANPEAAGPHASPVVRGRVVAHHRHEWRYSGPVLHRDSQQQPAVTHVLDTPRVTMRLVLAAAGGSLLALPRHGSPVPAVGDWVTAAGGRFELLSITPGE